MDLFLPSFAIRYSLFNINMFLGAGQNGHTLVKKSPWIPLIQGFKEGGVRHKVSGMQFFLEPKTLNLSIT